MPWAVGSWANSRVANRNVAQGHAYFAGTCGFLRKIEQKAAGLRQTAAQPCATGVVTRTIQGAIGGAGFVAGTVHGAIARTGSMAGIVQDQVEVGETVSRAAVEKTETE